jgi:hypothetical protein
MAKNEFDKMSLIGHTGEAKVKSRIIQYFETPSGVAANALSKRI